MWIFLPVQKIQHWEYEQYRFPSKTNRSFKSYGAPLLTLSNHWGVTICTMGVRVEVCSVPYKQHKPHLEALDTKTSVMILALKLIQFVLLFFVQFGIAIPLFGTD
jgi:hypothetical protein